jgi:RNA-directed DNA polymerase
VDGLTTAAEGQHLEANLQDLQARRKTKRSRQQPLRRVHRPKARGKPRPLGLSACEDQVVQDARREVLAALYAQDLLDGSPGVRPARNAQDAVRTLQRRVEWGEGRWSDEADMVSCFASVERNTRKERLGRRVAEGSLLRRMGKGVHVGGLDGDAVWEPEGGPAQGAGRSPVLGHVSRHYGRDRWGATAGKPRLQGQATVRRYGDEFRSGVAREDEARRVVAVLDKRLERCGLARHPDKTRRLPWRRPPKSQPSGKGPATCDCVGCTC